MTKSKAQALRSCIYHKNNNGMGGVAIEKKTGLKIYVLENAENFALEGDEVIVAEDTEKQGMSYGTIQKIEKHNATT